MKVSNIFMMNVSRLLTRNRILILSFVVFLITAINSVGFYHADEHFQIIEFAMSKVHPDVIDNLPWEYDDQIRPALQPTIAYLTISALTNLGLDSPYFQSFFLRLFSALLAFFLIKSYVVDDKRIISDKERAVYLFSSLLLWFVPFVAVRFSSENLSGLFFFWALMKYLSDEKGSAIKVGLLLGISFLFRFQIAFAIVGFGLWMMFVKKESFLFFIRIIGVFGIVLLGGFFLDSWFYGNFVFTPWNYFYSNIVLDVASTFGVEPIDYYLSRTLFEPIFPIGLLVLTSFLFLTIYKRTSVYLWILVSYVLFHSLVPHKEYRFMYPMVYLIVPMCLESYVLIKNAKYIRIKHFLKKYLYLLLVVNCIALGFVMLKPPGSAYVTLSHYVYRNYNGKSINAYYTSWASPYCYGNDLLNSFYNESNIKNYYVDDLKKIAIIPNSSNDVNLLCLKIYENEIFSVIDKRLNSKGFILKKSALPIWYYKFVNKYRRIQDKEMLLLYEYDSKCVVL